MKSLFISLLLLGTLHQHGQAQTDTATFCSEPHLPTVKEGRDGFVLETIDQDTFYKQLYTADHTLPIAFLFYYATAQSDRTTLLDWSTPAELNHPDFQIQRHVGSGWQTIGFVEGKDTLGSSKWYRFVDPVPASGWNYYCLTQKDQEDTRFRSTIQAVYFENDLQLSVYPNPTVDYLYIRRQIRHSGWGPLSWKLFSASGQIMGSSHSITNYITLLDLSQLAPGSYELHLEQEGIKTIHVVVKQ